MLRREHAELLLQKAAQDELALDLLLQHDSAPVEAIGFHAQQAAKKLLKAAITAVGAEYPFTHLLDRLLRLLRQVGIEAPGPLWEVRRLAPFAGEFRYEAILGDDPLAVDGQASRQLLRDLRAWVEALIEAQPREAEAPE